MRGPASPTTTASSRARPAATAFICGQNPFRTGLTKVGMPGAEIGLQDEDVTIATALKDQGYATGQFGKNHLGDLDRFLPTNHGFDEFFGNLYHLNAEEEPEQRDYPSPEEFPDFPRAVRAPGRDPQLRRRSGGGHRPAHQGADEADRATRSWPTHATGFIDAAHESDTPFLVWFNTTHMHFRTHARDDADNRLAAMQWVPAPAAHRGAGSASHTPRLSGRNRRQLARFRQASGAGRRG